MRRYAHIAVLFLLAGRASSQFYSLPNDFQFNQLCEKVIARRDSMVHPGMQPYIPFFNQRFSSIADSQQVFRYIKQDPAIDIFFRDHFLKVRSATEDFTLHIDPLLNLEAGRDLSDSSSRNFYTNSRGFAAAGAIGKRFYFETMFAENQSVFPDYLDERARQTGVVPGQGRWKGFKSRGFDYAFATGLASIQLWRNVNLQFGHGKQKVGHGYRSLLLSDNSFNYPFARITQQWLKGKLRYTNIYASLMNLVPAATIPTPHTERLFQKKSAAFQYLEIQPFRSLNIAFFQGVIWQPGNYRNKQSLTWQYFNPVIYSHLATFGLDHNEHNVLVGTDIIYKLTDRLSVYAQLMADRSELGGIQGGLKYFDAFGIKNLTLRAEYTSASRQSYEPQQGTAYYHYNNNLAFTPANGSEFILITDYRRNRFFFSSRHHQQSFHSTIRHSGAIHNILAGYLVNPAYNLNISIGYTSRRNFYYIGTRERETNYLYVSLKTSIYNLYYDF